MWRKKEGISKQESFYYTSYNGADFHKLESTGIAKFPVASSYAIVAGMWSELTSITIVAKRKARSWCVVSLSDGSCSPAIIRWGKCDKSWLWVWKWGRWRETSKPWQNFKSLILDDTKNSSKFWKAEYAWIVRSWGLKSNSHRLQDHEWLEFIPISESSTQFRSKTQIGFPFYQMNDFEHIKNCEDMHFEGICGHMTTSQLSWKISCPSHFRCRLTTSATTSKTQTESSARFEMIQRIPRSDRGKYGTSVVFYGPGSVFLMGLVPLKTDIWTRLIFVQAFARQIRIRTDFWPPFDLTSCISRSFRFVVP